MQKFPDGKGGYFITASKSESEKLEKIYPGSRVDPNSENAKNFWKSMAKKMNKQSALEQIKQAAFEEELEKVSKKNNSTLKKVLLGGAGGGLALYGGSKYLQGLRRVRSLKTNRQGGWLTAGLIAASIGGAALRSALRKSNMGRAARQSNMFRNAAQEAKGFGDALKNVRNYDEFLRTAHKYNFTKKDAEAALKMINVNSPKPRKMDPSKIVKATYRVV